MRTLSLSLLLCLVAASMSPAKDREADKVKEAIERGLKVITRAAKAYPEHRQCFSCHHQTLPMQAMQMAQMVGYQTEKEVKDVFAQQLKFTQEFFESKKETLARGDRIGGAAATVSYGLWTLEIADAEPSEVTDAMVKNLLKLQHDDGHWQPPSLRPPLEESHVSCTVLSAYGIQKYARGEQVGPDRKPLPEAKLAFDKANEWLRTAKLESTEDLSFSLLWNTCIAADEARATAIYKTLLARQREDGGWGQLPGMESDAYATGQALMYLSLYETGVGGDGEPKNKKAVAYLLSTQKEDGSWHVKTRSKPVQKFFDNGDPHGADQFISIAATSWATTALMMANIHKSPAVY